MKRFDKQTEGLFERLCRAYLLRLIARMNSKVSHRISSKTPAWRAYRRAEKLRDPRFLPILKEIILEYPDRSGEDTREAAYFIMARLLIKVPDAGFISFYIDRITMETDRDVRSRMLTHLGRIVVPQTQSMESLIEMTNDPRWQIRHEAIYALSCQDSERCRSVLRRFAALEDHRAHRDDIIMAQAALGKIGDERDLAMLEKNIKSRSRHIRESAAFVAQQIRQRTGKP